MTVNPVAGRSKAQIRAFERIAIGQEPIAMRSTIEALLRDGLIEQTGTKVVGRDGFGTIEIPIYEVPIPAHHAWCSWCATQVDHLDECGPGSA